MPSQRLRPSLITLASVPDCDSTLKPRRSLIAIASSRASALVWRLTTLSPRLILAGARSLPTSAHPRRPDCPPPLDPTRLRERPVQRRSCHARPPPPAAAAAGGRDAP